MAASAVVSLAAVPASADSSFTIKGNPAQLQVGTSYELDFAPDYSVSVPGSGSPHSVYFYDNGQCIGEDMGFGGIISSIGRCGRRLPLASIPCRSYMARVFGP